MRELRRLVPPAIAKSDQRMRLRLCWPIHSWVVTVKTMGSASTSASSARTASMMMRSPRLVDAAAVSSRATVGQRLAASRAVASRRRDGASVRDCSTIVMPPLGSVN